MTVRASTRVRQPFQPIPPVIRASYRPGDKVFGGREAYRVNDDLTLTRIEDRSVAIQRTTITRIGLEENGYPYPPVLLAISAFLRSVTLGKALIVLAFALVLLFALVAFG
jgi:hypothetical protein